MSSSARDAVASFIRLRQTMGDAPSPACHLPSDWNDMIREPKLYLNSPLFNVEIREPLTTFHESR